MAKFSLKGLLFLFVASSFLKNSAAQNFSIGEQDDDKSVTTESSTTSKPQDEIKAVIENWENFDRAVKRVVNRGIKSMLPSVMERYDKSNVSSTCMRNFLRFIAGLKESKVWAFSILDASGKAVDGLLSGSLATLGEYDQCINTEAINDRKGRNYGQVLFTGKYCALDMRPPLPPKKPFYRADQVLDELKNFSQKGTVAAEIAKTAQFFYTLSLRLGICVPSGCSREDISSVLKNMMKEGVSGWSLTVKRCEIKQRVKITPVMMFVGAVYGFFALLLIIGTVIDLIYYKKKQRIYGTCLKLLTSFSFVTNFRRLVNTSTSTSELACLNGVRVLSITWIILGHTYMNINYQIFRGFKKVIAYREDFAFQGVINGNVAVDSFFFMGGLVLCYLTMKLVKGMKKPFNIFFYVFHRLWRLLPLYVAVILIVFLIPIMGNGPIWHDTIDHEVDACYKNWWVNLVFLGNYVPAEDRCLPHTWYIACDFQLYLFSLVILLPLLRWPKVGISLAVLCIVASIISASLITYLNNYPPTLLFLHPDVKHMFKQITAYSKPYPHAAPYATGILVGYFLAMKPKTHFPRVVLILGWCAAAICNLSVLYGVWGWNKGREPEFWETMFYSGCHRTAWALGLAWVVICCEIGQGGVVHYILTWKAWVPIGRLTYAAYLVHFIVQFSILGAVRTKLQPSHDFAVWMYFGHLMVTYGVSFALSMLIEAPLLAVEKIFLQKKGSIANEANNRTGMTATVLANGHTKECRDNEVNFNNGIPNNEVCRL